MLFGIELVILQEVIILTTGTRFRDQEKNEKILAEDHDTTDELRDLAKIWIELYPQILAKSYNKKYQNQ